MPAIKTATFCFCHEDHSEWYFLRSERSNFGRKYFRLLCTTMAASVTDAFTLLINKRLTVFFDERSLLKIRQNIENRFRGTAEFRTELRYDYLPVNQDRMSQHGIQQFDIAETVFRQAYSGLHIV